MANILEQIQIWVEQIITTLGVTGIAVLMFIENLFPPIPSEVILPFAGFLVVEGEMNLVAVFLAGTIGALAGAIFIYYLGAQVTESWMRGWFKKYGHFLLLSEKDYDRASTLFNRHGKKMVLIGRLMPAVRSLISLPAGHKRMKLSTFLLYTALGTALWNSLLLGAGLYLGENWRQIVQFVNTYEYLFWTILAMGLVYYVLKRLYSRHNEDQMST